MTVPLSEAVARRVPVELRESIASGDLCAWMMLVTERVTASKRRTSPFCEVGVGAPGVEGVLGEGNGDG